MTIHKLQVQRLRAKTRALLALTRSMHDLVSSVDGRARRVTPADLKEVRIMRDKAAAELIQIHTLLQDLP